MTRAVAIVEKASASEKMRRLAFRRQLAETDMISRLEGSRRKGVAEGEAKNQAEVARRMLQEKMPLSKIAALSGLSEAAVKRLAAEKKA